MHHCTYRQVADRGLQAHDAVHPRPHQLQPGLPLLQNDARRPPMAGSSSSALHSRLMQSNAVKKMSMFEGSEARFWDRSHALVAFLCCVT